jgi:tRNA-dihydrouridine synthase A
VRAAYLTPSRAPVRVSLAPMMERTDRWFRRFLREITRETLLYTEMIVADAIVHGPRDRLLRFFDVEHPISLQVGGDDPATLALAARQAAEFGYDEINLNVGCPSPRVQAGRFGACLMLDPAHVAACVASMVDATSLPVTVKHRIGVDDQDRYEDMVRFVDIVRDAGAARFTVHARKAWLSGLSPKENREVPPLRWADVHRLKRDRPDLEIEINGGIRSVEEIARHLERSGDWGVDAVMVGRAMYDSPFAFADVDTRIYGVAPRGAAPRTRVDVIDGCADDLASCVSEGRRPVGVLRHLLNLYAGVPGARAWKHGLDALARDTPTTTSAPAAPTAPEERAHRLAQALRALVRDVEQRRLEHEARQVA